MNYHEITPEMTIGDLITSGHYGELANYIFTYMTPDHWNCPLENYGFEKVGFVPTLHRMEELSQSGRNYIYPIYSKKESMVEWDKADASFIHFPGPVPNCPYAVIIPGGAFNRQWGLVEGFAIASHLNELGYSAFVLFYRVKQEPIMPKPIEDMHACVRYIESHADEFQVQAGHYILGGFSAGATIAGEMGSTNLGWKQAGVPKPEMIFLGYTAISMSEFYKAYTSLPDGHPVKEGIAPFLRHIGGVNFTSKTLAPYNLIDFIDKTYPPVYIVANEDDRTVPVANSLLLDKICTERGILHKTRIGSQGDHSFGLGVGLDVEGWLDEAVAFWQETMKNDSLN